MSKTPQERTGPGETRTGAPVPVPVAYPPRAAGRGGRPGAKPIATLLPLSEPAVSPTASLWTLATLKSWGGSVGMHAALLLVLASWYFTPPIRVPVEFDARIGGSPLGVDEGATILGGFNTPEDMPGSVDPIVGASPEPLLELSPMKPDRLSLSGPGAKASAAGGPPNDEPGAGDGTGFGLARFGDGSESIRGVAVKVGDPQFTLLWNNDVDLDLHVIEPGGKEINWENRKGAQGGELDVDNTKGYGPENVYWLVETDDPEKKVKGAGPPGDYRWFVAYYGGFGGIPKPTQWQVRVKHAGRVTVHRGKLRSLDERSKTYTLTVGPRGGFATNDNDEAEGSLLPSERP